MLRNRGLMYNYVNNENSQYNSLPSKLLRAAVQLANSKILVRRVLPFDRPLRKMTVLVTSYTIRWKCLRGLSNGKKMGLETTLCTVGSESKVNNCTQFCKKHCIYIYIMLVYVNNIYRYVYV